ncbi:MAG: hypothetical protein K6G52_01160 [Treponemataceae bacterium]|nr:hypothetical protein [Treponemataceae bacterium]
MKPLFSDFALLKGEFDSAKDAKLAFEKSGKLIELGPVEKCGSIYYCPLIHPCLAGCEKSESLFIPLYNAFCFASEPFTEPRTIRVFQVADGTFEEKLMDGASSILLNTEKKLWVKIK